MDNQRRLTLQIQANTVSLIRDQRPELVLDHLISQLVFTPEEQDMVEAEGTRQSKNRKLLELIRIKSQDQQTKYIQALRNSEQAHLADQILRTPLPEEEMTGWIVAVWLIFTCVSLQFLVFMYRIANFPLYTF